MRIAELRRCAWAAVTRSRWPLNGNDRGRAQQNAGDAVVHLWRDAWIDVARPVAADFDSQVVGVRGGFDLRFLDRDVSDHLCHLNDDCRFASARHWNWVSKAHSLVETFGCGFGDRFADQYSDWHRARYLHNQVPA